MAVDGGMIWILTHGPAMFLLRQRLEENAKDEEWLLQCQQNLRVVMSELWPKIHELEMLVEEELRKIGDK